MCLGADIICFSSSWNSGKSKDTNRPNLEAIMSTEFLYFDLDSVIEHILDHLLEEGLSLFCEWDERNKEMFCVTRRLDHGRNTYLSNIHMIFYIPQPPLQLD